MTPFVVPFWAAAVIEGDVEAELGPESIAGDSIVRRSRADEVIRESASAWAYHEEKMDLEVTATMVTEWMGRTRGGGVWEKRRKSEYSVYEITARK